MKLTSLYCNGLSKLTDLSPLAGMPLEDLDIRATAVSEFSPLRRLPLKTINGKPAEEFWKEVEKK